MSRKEVVQTMGQPDLNEAYKLADGAAIYIYFYYTQRRIGDGSVTKEECTPVVFKDDKLIGWGDEYYQTLPTRQELKIDADVNVKVEKEP